MKKLAIAIVTLFVTEAHAEIYKCIDEEKRVIFQQMPCKYKGKKLDMVESRPHYSQQNRGVPKSAIEIQNEVTRANNEKVYAQNRLTEINNQITANNNAAIANRNNTYRYVEPREDIVEYNNRKEREANQKIEDFKNRGSNNSTRTYYGNYNQRY